MKYLAVIALICFSVQSVIAQSQQELLILENGSQIRGDIQVQDDFSKVVIQTYDGSLWVFDTADISSIKIVDRYSPKNHISPKDTGYYNLTSFGLMIGSDGYYNTVNPSLQMINGYQFDQRLGAGFGVALEYFEHAYLPAFIETRYHLLSDRTYSPVVSIKTGYAIPLQNFKLDNGKYAQQGGILVGGDLGFRKYLANKFGLAFSTGYRFQYLVSQYDSWDWWTGETRIITRKAYYHRIDFRLSFLFN